MQCYRTSLRNFRIVGCTKRGKEAFLKIISDHTDYDCMICFIDNSCKLIDVTPLIAKKVKNTKPLIHNVEIITDLNIIFICYRIIRRFLIS